MTARPIQILHAALHALLCCCLVLSAQGRAYGRDHTFRHYTDVDGLPQNSVNGIILDRYHYAWMTTQDGIVRFDGNNFRVFNKNNIPGLHSNRFSHFRTDSSGGLYAVNDQSEFVKIGQTSMDMAPGFKAGVDQQLQSIGYSSGSSFWAKGYIDAWYGYPAKSKYFYSGDQKRFWECTQTQITLWAGGMRTRVIPFRSKDPVHFFEMAGLLCYNEGHHFWYVKDDRIVETSLSGAILKDPFYNRHPDSLVVYWNNLSPDVVIYCNRSFYLLQLDATGVLHTELLYNDVEILPSEITCIYYERGTKRLFVGSLTNGMYILQPQRFSVLTVNAPGKQNVYYAQTPFGREQVLTGDGILLGAGTEGKVVWPGRGDGYNIFTDHAGFIWKKEICYLYKYDSSMKQVGEWYFKPYITCIYEGADSIIWIGVRNSGLWQIDQKQVHPQPVFITNVPSEICYMQQLERNRLWIGTGNGLLSLNTQRRSLVSVAGLEGKYIRSLYLRQPDELWITTYEDGIFYYGNKKLVALPVDRDNFLKASHCIVEDHDGFFWISTNKGLFQVARQDMLHFIRGEQEYVYYHYYDKNDGFNTNEFNGGCQPSGLLLQNGYISFPSLNGLVWFNPRMMNYELPSERIIIDKVMVNNQPYKFSSNEILLPVKFERLRIELSTPYYGSERNIQMWYSVTHNGHASRWYSMNTDNDISFTNLSSGTHTLTVRKINGFGRSNYTVLTVSLVVPPPFYKTWWFFCLVLILAAAGIYAYTQLRLAYMVRRNKQLESLVSKRTSILNNTLQRLTVSEVKLKQQTQLQEKIVAAIGHDLKSPLRFVVLANQRIYEYLKERNTDAAMQISKDAYMAMDNTYNHISNFVEYVKAQMHQGQVHFEQVSLGAVVASKIAIFSLIARSRNITISALVDERLQVYSNSQLLSVVVHNLLDNATKYCSRCELTVRTVSKDGKLWLMIADRGPGMPPAIAAWLSAAPGTEQNEESYMPNGLGLLMVKELCALLRISIRVELNEGTRIYLGFSGQK